MAKILPISFIKTKPSGQEYELVDAKSRQDLSVMKDDIASLDLEIEVVKKSVSDGKILLADAITQKSVKTEPTASLLDMAENILKIIAGKCCIAEQTSVYYETGRSTRGIQEWNLQ